MSSFIEEMFLTEFFILDAVVGGFCDEVVLFDRIADIYRVDKTLRETLYKLATMGKVREVATLRDYNLYMRLRQFRITYKQNSSTLIDFGKKIYYQSKPTAFFGFNEDFKTESLTKCDEEEAIHIITMIKGKALRSVNESGLICSLGNTRASVHANIVGKAKEGNVTALRVYGFLQCEGIFFELNRKYGVKNLKRAARWNNIESLLALRLYDETQAEYADMLATLSKDTPYEELAAEICLRERKEKPKTVKECILLSKVFGRGQIDTKTYLPAYANLLYSEVIPFKNKEKLLISEGKEQILSYNDLPLKLTKREFSCDTSRLSDLPIKRSSEQNAVIRNAFNRDICFMDTFKPLCICSDSKVMRNYYMKAISEMYEGVHIETIDAADLNDRDIEPSADNIFLRSVNEDKANIFFISMVGDVNDMVLEEIQNFLQSAKRRRTNLRYPNIEIDLGAVMPICFCDKSNAQSLVGFCDKVEISEPDKKERAVLIGELLETKAKLYGLNELTVGEEIMEKLLSLPIDVADNALDLAIIANRQSERKINLTAENASEYLKKRELSRGYGYGGCKDAN